MFWTNQPQQMTLEGYVCVRLILYHLYTTTLQLMINMNYYLYHCINRTGGLNTCQPVYLSLIYITEDKTVKYDGAMVPYLMVCNSQTVIEVMNNCQN